MTPRTTTNDRQALRAETRQAPLQSDPQVKPGSLAAQDPRSQRSSDHERLRGWDARTSTVPARNARAGRDDLAASQLKSERRCVGQNARMQAKEHHRRIDGAARATTGPGQRRLGFRGTWGLRCHRFLGAAAFCRLGHAGRTASAVPSRRGPFHAATATCRTSRRRTATRRCRGTREGPWSEAAGQTQIHRDVHPQDSDSLWTHAKTRSLRPGEHFANRQRGRIQSLE